MSLVLLFIFISLNYFRFTYDEKLQVNYIDDTMIGDTIL